MILEYHRPETIADALVLLGRNDPPTYPLGGGNVLSKSRRGKFAVVDLQKLGLDQVEARGTVMEIGAAVTLQKLLEIPTLLPGLAEAITRQANVNLRQTGTIAGSLVSSDGYSPLATALLALDSRLHWLPGDMEVGLGDYLPVRKTWQGGRLIASISLPLNAELRFEAVARTPKDRPILCAAVARWPSGRTRVALGGPGASPLLAMDGPEAAGAEEAAFQAFSGDVQPYNLDYLKDVSRLLVRRMLSTL